MTKLSEVKTVACSKGGGEACGECVDMCARRPCWGTPDEIQKIIDAGHGDKLRLDNYVRVDSDIILLVAPAAQGHEGTQLPWWPSGRCAFLTDGGLCSLHEEGLKPLEGRAADCQSDLNGELDVHRLVAYSWRNAKARKIVAEWRAKYGRD
jgi:hypothetical protein